MTNGEKFKTEKERAIEFNWFCSGRCADCVLKNCNGTNECCYAWLDLEYKQELNPCPFCGGEAMERKSNKLYYIFCKNCSVKTVDTITPDRAIEAWNRRV